MYIFATDYYIFVLVASMGTIQFAASLGQLKGLLLFKSPLVARGLGIALAVSAFVWFFASESRDLNDQQGGLDAPTQGLFFFLGSLTAVVVTFLGSSLVNVRMNGGDPLADGGLDALKNSNYLSAVGHSLRFWWREWRTQMKSYFFR